MTIDQIGLCELGSLTIDQKIQLALAILTAALAIFALWQVFISRNTARIQLRAYMGVKVSNEILIDSHTTHIEISIVFHNYGVTPAYEVYYHGHLEILPYPLKGTEFKRPPAFDKTIYSPRIIQPNDEFSWKVKMAITAQQREYILAGEEKRLYLWGELRYRDIFNKETSEPRYSKFAFMFGGPDCVLTRKMVWAESGNAAS